MSKLNEYINSLEGQDNVDPLEVAGKLLELHNEEIGTRDAKIAELNDSIAAKDGDISSRDAEITKWKAKNFDLAMQIPGVKTPTDAERQEESESISIDDLFARKGSN